MRGETLPGTYPLQIDEDTRIDAFCLESGYTVIQSRGQFGNPKDYFLKKWLEYEIGFGTPGNF